MKREARKIIRFGNSSFVVSLPREWVEKNKLEKGDLIYLTQNDNGDLVIQPREKKQEKVDREITISIEGKDERSIKREIISAYLNNFSTVKIVGNLQTKIEFIRKIIKNLMAMEIIRQSKGEIIAKVFLDTDTIKFEEITVRMDVMLKSIFQDIIEIFKKGELSKEDVEEITSRDDDIDGLFFLSHKILKEKLENPSSLKFSKLYDLFRLWHTNYNLEYVSDRMKEIADVLWRTGLYKDKKAREKVCALLQEIEEVYVQIMKARYFNDVNSALQLAKRKHEIIEKIDSLLSKYWNKRGVPEICEKLKSMIKGVHAICRRIYS
ncbi:MAG: AbrB/MazE/SpoVT family DNA-binding domain-containing protein [Candidatus Pacearchaeota archaeon]